MIKYKNFLYENHKAFFMDLDHTNFFKYNI